MTQKKQVFLSSTFNDLKEHRAHAIRAIQDAGFTVDPMEHWGAAPEEPKVFSQERIAGCDLFVLLVGRRRGFIPVGETQSITQLEYNAARALGIDVLVHMLDDKAPWYAEFDDRARDPQVGAWRAQLQLDHGTAYFGLDPASLKLSADLTRWLTKMLAAAGTQTESEGRLAKIANALADTSDWLGTTEPRFVMRREYFGSLIYDRAYRDYMPFDEEATRLIHAAASISFDEAAGVMAPKITAEKLDAFRQLLISSGLLSASGFFSGELINTGMIQPHRLSAPTSVYLSCTAECNFACAHCYSASGERRPRELTGREIMDLIDEMARIGCFKLSLGGGEPLLRQDLPFLIEHANKRQVDVSISTNAAIASSEIVDTLRGLKLDELKISLPAASDAVAGLVRGVPATMAELRRGAAELSTLCVPICAHAVIMRSNMHEVASMVALAAEIGAVMFSLTAVLPAGRAAAQPEECLTATEMDLVWNTADAAADAAGIALKRDRAFPLKSQHLFEGFGCACPHMYCHIGPLGDVAPSGFLLGHTNTGNIRTRPLGQIWADHNAIGALAAATRTGNATCYDCDHYQGCRGGCRARALLSLGDIAAPDPTCPVAFPGAG